VVTARTHFAFPPFKLDAVNQELWCEGSKLVLRPKTFSLLLYFLEHPDRLIRKDELLDAVWPGVFVGDSVLRGCIQEIRKALNDDPREPRFLGTVARRGYRFIGELDDGDSSVRDGKKPLEIPSVPLSMDNSKTAAASSLVERESQMKELQAALEVAARGHRRLVFITGEPGIGKTALVDAFLSELIGRGAFWAARGQCIEQYGAGEAYMPVLEALTGLCRNYGDRALRVLDRHAPTWLEQMPSLLNGAELQALARRNQTSSRERMLRELAEAVEMLTVQQPLVLVLEDLHQSDPATLDALSMLSQRREPARLLMLGSYRPAEVRPGTHTLRTIASELHLHGLSHEITLQFLTQAAVDRYLAQRFSWSAVPAALSRQIHRHTDGNPLFVVSFVNLLVMNGVIAPSEGAWRLVTPVEQVALDVPDSLRLMVEKQVEGLSSEAQRLLDAASVAGVSFSPASLSDSLGLRTDEIDEICSTLARRGLLLKPHGIEERPSEGDNTRYSFIHELYQQVLYERLSAGRRTRLHLLVGESKERAFGKDAGNIASELAVHFEEGRDYRRAIKYLEVAARNVARRYANREAIAYLTHGLKLLEALPQDHQTLEQELSLLMVAGPAVLAIKGYTAVDVGRTYARARNLCQILGKPLFTVLRGLWVFHYMRAELTKARDLADALLKLAKSEKAADLLLESHYALAATQTCRGEFETAYTHATKGVGLYHPTNHRQHAFHYGQEPGVYCLLWESIDLWFLGSPVQAREKCLTMLSVAREAGHPFSLTTALFMAAILHQLCGDEAGVQEFTEAGGALAAEQGFTFWSAWKPIMQGWLLTERGQIAEGLSTISYGVRTLEYMETLWLQPYFLALLADAYGAAREPQDGLAVIATGISQAEKTGQHFFDAEMYRLRGELKLLEGSPNLESEAQQCFERAMEIAQLQSGKCLELRATVSLARLLLSCGQRDRAKNLLGRICGQFTRRPATRDLREAKALLASCHP